MRVIETLSVLLLGIVLLGNPLPTRGEQIYLGQSIIAGEVTTNSVILQTRLTAAEGVIEGDVPGIRGVGRFEVDTDPLFPKPIQSEWQHARSANDFIVKAKITGLKPDTDYYYRVWFGSHERQSAPDMARSFRTLGGALSERPVRFVIGSGMNFAKFHVGMADGVDKDNGYPVFGALYQLRPDFFIGNGNNVYYDDPIANRVKTVVEMRRKWHEQFVQMRLGQFFGLAPTYWLKGEHDYRGNEMGVRDEELPTAELGRQLFQEQLPVIDPQGTNAVTYRTQRINKHVQLWLLEAFDYRSGGATNVEPSQWGAEQKAWLKQTLKESDATFKLIVTPTPLVGIGAGEDAFGAEREEFFRWLKENQIGTNQLFIVSSGPWQQHVKSIDGYEEFSCGVLHKQNAIAAPKAVEGISNLYAAKRQLGGFLLAEQNSLGGKPQLTVTFKDESGTSQYFVIKQASK